MIESGIPNTRGHNVCSVQCNNTECMLEAITHQSPSIRKTFIDFIEIDDVLLSCSWCVCAFVFLLLPLLNSSGHVQIYLFRNILLFFLFLSVLHSFIFQRKSGRMIKIEHVEMNQIEWIRFRFDEMYQNQNLLQNEQWQPSFSTCGCLFPIWALRSELRSRVSACVPGRRVRNFDRKKINYWSKFCWNSLHFYWWIIQIDGFCVTHTHWAQESISSFHRIRNQCLNYSRFGVFTRTHTSSSYRNHEHIILYHRNSMNADDREQKRARARSLTR